MDPKLPRRYLRVSRSALVRASRLWACPVLQSFSALCTPTSGTLPIFSAPSLLSESLLAAVPTLFLPFASSKPLDTTEEKDSWRLVLLIRPGKVYVFIAGLVALSDGLRPLVDAYIHRLPNGLLFWMNTISAVVNNSTLAAVEIGPSLSMNQQRAALLGLLISGGALVTGNIPNIVAASRLGITSREWAKIGLGTGALLLILCFAVLSSMAFFQ